VLSKQGAAGHRNYLELNQSVGETFLVTMRGPISPRFRWRRASGETDGWQSECQRQGTESRAAASRRAASTTRCTAMSLTLTGASNRIAGAASSLCRRAHSETQRAVGRARAQARLPIEVRLQLLDAIYAGQPFRAVVRQLNLTPNQVWGLTKTDEEWSAALEAALTSTRRDDLKHGSNAAHVAGCVCSDCREHRRVRMAKNRS
jgi:hypothetical protein